MTSHLIKALIFGLAVGISATAVMASVRPAHAQNSTRSCTNLGGGRFQCDTRYENGNRTNDTCVRMASGQIVCNGTSYANPLSQYYQSEPDDFRRKMREHFDGTPIN